LNKKDHPNFVENFLESLCKKDINNKMKGCDNKNGAIRALKQLAGMYAGCDISDRENAKKINFSSNSTSVIGSEDELEGWFDDGSSGGDYSCGSKCTWDVLDGCYDSCAGSIAECSDIYDIVSIPSCIRAAEGCFQDLTGACCTCGAYYELYTCADCSM